METAEVHRRRLSKTGLEVARKAFLDDPASLTIYTLQSGDRSARGRVHGKLDERLEAAIAAYLSAL